jgi:hypothetical protein
LALALILICRWIGEGLLAMRHSGFDPALEMYKESSQEPEICVKRSQTVLCEWR